MAKPRGVVLDDVTRLRLSLGIQDRRLGRAEEKISELERAVREIADAPVWLDTSQLAEHIGLSRHAVYELLRNSDLNGLAEYDAIARPSTRKILIDRSRFEQWMRGQYCASPAP